MEGWLKVSGSWDGKKDMSLSWMSAKAMLDTPKTYHKLDPVEDSFYCVLSDGVLSTFKSVSHIITVPEYLCDMLISLMKS